MAGLHSIAAKPMLNAAIERSRIGTSASAASRYVCDTVRTTFISVAPSAIFVPVTQPFRQLLVRQSASTLHLPQSGDSGQSGARCDDAEIETSGDPVG